MTLESWSMGISRPVMEVFPWAWAYFVPFVIISAFIMVNIVVGIIVDVVDESKKEAEAEDIVVRQENEDYDPEDDLSMQLSALKDQVDKVEKLVAAKQLAERKRAEQEEGVLRD